MGVDTPLPLQWKPSSSTRALWEAEGIGTIFEETRVRRIHQAQDALSLVEEKVYDLLWGPKNQRRDEFRLVHYSLQRIATEARINIKTVRDLIPRLIDKGFIAIEHEADVRRNIPTLYRVFSYAAVLNDQRSRKRFFMAKTGKGVFYVHAVSASVGVGLEPMGLELDGTGLRPMGVDVIPGGLRPMPAGLEPMGPVGSGGSKPMGASGGLSIGSDLGKKFRQTTATTLTVLVQSIQAALNLEPDQGLLNGMIQACHENSLESTGSEATEEELIYFTATKAKIVSRASNIRNHLAVLRKAVPECFVGETFRAYRAAAAGRWEKAAEEERRVSAEREDREQEGAEAESRYRLWTEISERYRGERGYDMYAIANDPMLDEAGRRQARGMMERLGRFTRAGL